MPPHAIPFSTKTQKARSWPKFWFNYLLREQRLLFVLVGMLIASTFFMLQPSVSKLGAVENRHSVYPTAVTGVNREEIEGYGYGGSAMVAKNRRVPVGVKSPGRRIVVTGGAGFVGSHLVDRLLDRGDNVIVVDNFFTGRKENVVHHFGNPRFELIRHDVVEPILLEVDQIYHLACPASPVHYKYNPIKTIISFAVTIILLYSCSLCWLDMFVRNFGANFKGFGCLGVRSCYDEGKRTAETLAMDYHRGANVEVRIARIFNTYGPRMCIDDGRVVSNFVAQALRGEPMTVYGDGKQTRSFQYVSDLVDGLIRLMEGEHVGPFNLGNPGEFTMLELAEVVKEIVDPSAKIVFKPNTADDPHKRKPDISKAKELLNWEPKVPLKEGLPLMVTDFRKRVMNDDN
ncbi:UDP-glucuronic acid decarboxylase 1 [Nymphaea thermarum]|nr:UDP-glucuronic acid decarboxylase 1 [Nymphaea thermarum]